MSVWAQLPHWSSDNSGGVKCGRLYSERHGKVEKQCLPGIYPKKPGKTRRSVRSIGEAILSSIRTAVRVMGQRVGA